MFNSSVTGVWVIPGYHVMTKSVVTFICQTNLGPGPGQLAWYYYLNGSPKPYRVSGNSKLGITVEGRSCGNLLQSTLRLTMLPEFDKFSVRCTRQQTVYTDTGDGSRQSDSFNVMCKYYVPYFNSEHARIKNVLPEGVQL